MQDPTPEHPASPPEGTARILLIVSLLLTLVFYWLHAGDFFVLDSVGVLSENNGLNFDITEFDRWRIAAMSSESGIFGRYLSNLSFTIDALLAGGADPRAMKLSNVLLHLLTAVLAWRLLCLALARSPVLSLDGQRARWIAAIAVAIWVVHPLQVSTVMYTVQRMTQLSALFTVAGLWFYCARRVRWLEQAPTAADLSSTLLGLTVFTLLAMFSKENGMLLPLYVAVLELCLFRGRSAGGRVELPYRLSQLALLVPALVVVLLLVIQPDWLVNWYAHRSFGLEERVLTQLRVLWHYLSWMLLWDVQALGLFHDDIAVSRSLWQPLTTLFALIAWLGLAGLAWHLRNRLPLLAFALLWYLVGHIMESTIIPLELVFEHRNYLPSLGPILMLGWVLTAIPSNRFGYAALGGGIAVAVLGFLLFVRTSFWASELTLAESFYRHQPESARARFNLANVYIRQTAGVTDMQVAKKYSMAARELHRKNVQQYQGYVPSLTALIYIESAVRQNRSVQALYRRLAVELDRPNISSTEISALRQFVACLDRGVCLVPEGGTREYLERLIAQQDLVITRELLMRHCLSKGDRDCVREQAEAALAMNPDFVFGYRALYSSSLSDGDTAGAQAAAQRMLMADEQRRQIYGIRNSAAARR